MTYNPGVPQPTDIPADSQDDFLNDFMLLNEFFGNDHIPFGNTITFATSANPCVCTSPNHGLSTGNSVYISHFGSLIGGIITMWSINGGPYTATKIDANTFSLNVDASAQPPYLANTGAFASPSLPYGEHTKTFFPNVVQQGPNTAPPLGSPYSAYYSKQIEKVAQLFFQNDVGEAFENQLTQLAIFQKSTKTGFGFVTPWGIIVNMGPITTRPISLTFTFPIQFKKAVWSITGSIQDSSTNKHFVVFNAISLTQFTAILGGSGPIESKINTYYLAIGQ